MISRCPNCNRPIEQPNNKNKVKLASIAGSALGIGAAVGGIYMAAKKGNPQLALKNLVYNEKDALIIGTSAIAGGLIGGLTTDKKENAVPKLREATQQLVGNTLFPLATLAGANKLLNKINIKMPQIKSASKPAKIANAVLTALPKAVTTILALNGGMKLGNKIVNKVNDKICNEEVKHCVKPEDYLVHTDDICLTANMLFNNTKNISKITSKILPISFIVSGAKTGMQQKQEC